MKLVIQRVEEASVSVDGEVIGQVGKGFMVLVGFTHGDTEEKAQKLAKKMLGLRIFPDSEGKTNLSLKDVGGGLLIVSQFTLYADCRKGNRPSFVHAAAGDMANELYEYLVELCRKDGVPTETGRFGAMMEVELINDGPFTVMLEE